MNTVTVSTVIIFHYNLWRGCDLSINIGIRHLEVSFEGFEYMLGFLLFRDFACIKGFESPWAAIHTLKTLNIQKL